MKACVLHAMHDVRYEEYADPSIKSPEEVVVRMQRGGICGSDMHYYEEGCVGVFKVREAFILGHEGAGVVEKVGANVTKVKEGDRVTIRPARACLKCQYCLKGQHTYCLNVTHLGSASTMPHTNGLFADKVVVHEEQLAVVHNISAAIAAFAEPLAVAFNGVRSVGECMGKEVLVMGGGPIGALCAAAARLQGAASVTVVDVRQSPLDICSKMGIDQVVNSRTNPEQIEAWKKNRGHFELMIEASGNAFALADGLAMVKPEGTVSQVGMFAAGGEPKALSPFLNKGIKWVGVFRFYDEFTAAVRALELGHIDPTPLLSAAYPASECAKAIKEALGEHTCKVQLILGE